MCEGPLKVLHITECFEGGVATWLGHVLPRLEARGVLTWLACSPRDPSAARSDLASIEAGGTHVRIVPMRRNLALRTDGRALEALRDLIRREGFDIVHTHGFKAGLLGRWAAAVRDTMRVVHTPHCFAFTRCRGRWLARAIVLIERRLARRTDHLLFVSASERRIAFAKNILPDDAACSVVRNGVGPAEPLATKHRARLRRAWGLAADEPVVGYCGRLVEAKCVDHLLRAVPFIRTVVPNVRFLIVGDGPRRTALMRLARRARLDGAVRFTGHCQDGAALVGLMDVCVVCSKAEGLSYVILEAFNARTPVVASDVPGNVDLVVHGRTGLSYPFGRFDRLAEAVTACLTDPALRRHVTDNARRVLEQDCSVQQQVDGILAAYNKVAYRAAHICEPVPADDLRLVGLAKGA